MRRVYVTVVLEPGDTIEELASFLDLSKDELLSFNPRLHSIFVGKEVPSAYILASIQLKVAANQAYPSSIQLGYYS